MDEAASYRFSIFSMAFLQRKFENYTNKLTKNIKLISNAFKLRYIIYEYICYEYPLWNQLCISDVIIDFIVSLNSLIRTQVKKKGGSHALLNNLIFV